MRPRRQSRPYDSTPSRSDARAVSGSEAVYGGNGASTGTQGVAVPGFAFTNFGSISATGQVAVSWSDASSFTNGSETDKNASIIGSYVAVQMGGAAPVNNFGTIDGKETTVSPLHDTVSGVGIFLGSSGGVTTTGPLINGSTTDRTALISGGYEGVAISDVSAGSPITNYGTIASPAHYGVSLGANDVLTNTVGALIDGNVAGIVAGNALNLLSETIFNSGTISGTTGLLLIRSVYTPQSVPTKTPFTFASSTTITNAGTIESTAGTAGTAIYFAGAATIDGQFLQITNRLIIDPGAVFIGNVVVGPTADPSQSTLELATGNGAISGLGTQFANFAATQVDAGATWDVTGSANQIAALEGSGALALSNTTLDIGDASAFTGTITLADALATFDTGAPTAMFTVSAGSGIDLKGLAWRDPTPAYNSATGQLAVGSATLNVGAGLTGLVFVAHEDTTGHTLVTVNAACFAAGTRISTARGKIAVEDLCVGDTVHALFAGATPAIWIGHRRVDCRHHPRPDDVWPVRIGAHAFGEGRPSRDLRLSPDHAVFADGALIPIRYLVNGATIVQEAVDTVTYWHVELDRHDVILAEGLPCETYLDTGNRAAFANGDTSVQIHPDFALRIWDADACAPLVLDGPRMITAKRGLLARASALGHSTAADPDLKILANGREVPAETDGHQWRLRLPEATESVRLTSRVWVPAQIRPDEQDTRRLGIAISRMWLDGREVSLDSAGLSAGWHAPEPNWRWTNGDAVLVMPGVSELVFEVAMTGTYWQDEACRQSRAA